MTPRGPPPRHPFHAAHKRLSPSAISNDRNAPAAYNYPRGYIIPNACMLPIPRTTSTTASHEHRGSFLQLSNTFLAIYLSVATILLFLPLLPLLLFLLLELQQLTTGVRRSPLMLRTIPFDDMNIDLEIITRWRIAPPAVLDHDLMFTRCAFWQGSGSQCGRGTVAVAGTVVVPHF